MLVLVLFGSLSLRVAFSLQTRRRCIYQSPWYAAIFPAGVLRASLRTNSNLLFYHRAIPCARFEVALVQPNFFFLRGFFCVYVFSFWVLGFEGLIVCKGGHTSTGAEIYYERTYRRETFHVRDMPPAPNYLRSECWEDGRRKKRNE